jgi:hypothetical protein
MLEYTITSGPDTVAVFVLSSSRSVYAFCAWVRAYTEQERAWNPNNRAAVAIIALEAFGYGLTIQEVR